MNPSIFRDLEALVLLAIAVVALPTSVWMLAAPLNWYATFPGKIGDFGDFNVHFVRDLGCVYLTMSTACIWAAFSSRVRFPILVAATLFFTLHAIIHVFDTLRGHVNTEHFLLDFPSTYLPSILLIYILLLAWKKRANTSD